MYRLFRPLLFRLDAELSHELTVALLRKGYRLPGFSPLVRALVPAAPPLPVRLMSLTFPNPVGLAAGFDKNGCCLEGLADLGFGHLEIGTVTPRPQQGNPKKRLFRLVAQRALINRMGFNNVGVETLVANVRHQRRPPVLGINIGKNRDTPTEQAVSDYRIAFRAVYPYADYIVANISSPNTPNLRDMQAREPLEQLLVALKEEQADLRGHTGRYVPVVVKVSPDEGDERLVAAAQLIRRHRIDGVIATNTTVSRPGIPLPQADIAGGLSGAPLRALSTHAVQVLYQHLRGDIPIIASGGVMDADDAWEKLVSGADLVQIYTALVYGGPGIVRRIVAGLARRVRQSGAATLSEAVLAQRGRHSSENAH